MAKPTRRVVLLAAAAVAVLLLLAWAFLPKAVAVETALVGRAPLQVTVEEEGETRIRDRYVVSAPVAAFASRIALEEGDVVNEGDAVVRLEPPRAAILDPRTQSEAAARVRAADAAVANATVQAERASADRKRVRTLYDAGAVAEREMEEASAAATRATAALATARAELTAARAAAGVTGGSAPPPAVLRSPVAGRVLAVHGRSGGPVSPGQPLIEIGDTRAIEVIADVLSQDAVRIAPGTRVIIDQWGGDGELEAVVTRVEPEGTTRISALGVEEQRVPVRADITSPAAAWAGLGSGYRVLARFVLWEGTDVLQVPTSALFRSGDGWAVFVARDGRAVRQAVEIGHQAGLAAEIVSGLSAGERVVVHPPNELADGTRISQREGANR